MVDLRNTPLLLSAGMLLVLAGCGNSPSQVKADDPLPAEGTGLTDTPYYEANPTVSPDGLWVVYESDEDGDMEIYMIPAVGGQAQQLTDNQDFDSSPIWAPDGSALAFESDRSGRKHLYVMDPDHPQESLLQLTSGDFDDGSPAWSPLWSWIAFESNRGKVQGTDIFIVAVDGSETRQITTTPSQNYCRSADWSPQGNRLVYESNESGSSALYIIAATGGKGDQITPDSGYEGHPAWSPLGERIAFEATISGSSQIYLVGIDGGLWTQLTFQGGFWPQWTPAGDAIVYCVFDGLNADVRTIPVE